MAQRARQAKLRNAFIKASKNKQIANAKANAAKNATEKNAALKAASNAQNQLKLLKEKMAANKAAANKAAANKAAANKAAANKAAANKAAAEENARKKAAAEEEARRKAEEAARKKALTNKFGTSNYNFNKFKNANASVVNRYAKLITLRRNFMNATEANSLLKPTNSLMNANQLNAMVVKTQKNRREALGIPIIVGVFNPGTENTTNHNGMNFANGSIKLNTSQTLLNMNAIIQNSIPSLGDIFSTQSNSNNVGIILMGSSGSGKTYFANKLLKGYLEKSGYTPSPTKMYYGGAYLNGRLVQQEDNSGNGATIFNTGIKGASHCAPTPFNPESSRAQEITTYQGHGRSIHVIDMAGNEDIMKLYTTYSGDESSFNLTRLLSNITVTKLGQPELKLKGTLPVIDIAIKYRKKLISISNNPRYKDSIPNHTYDLKNVTLTAGMETDKRKNSFKIMRKNDTYKKELIRALNSLAYITARCSEGVYITSTMRALIQYLKIYRETRNRKEAMNTATGLGMVNNSGIANNNEIRNMFPVSNRESAKAVKTIKSNSGVRRTTSIVKSVTSGKPYSLNRSNEFLKEVATYDNTVLFPLLFSGQNDDKRRLAKQTYGQMTNLAKQKINRNIKK